VLHVLNGDATAAALDGSAVPGERLVWRDIAVEGPAASVGRAVPAERTAYLSANFAIDAEDYVRGVEAQTARLATAPEHDEVVLWFEQDLFCTVTLWSLLDWANRELPGAALSLVYPALDGEMKGLGALPRDRLAALFADRRSINDETRTLGADAWAAYASPDPLASARLLEQASPALPFVSDAFRCHLGRFPSVRNGLSQVEGGTLAVLRRGPLRFGDLFREVTAHRDIRGHGMGDQQFAAGLWRLTPLVAIEGATVTTAEISLTPQGSEVDSGGVDWLALQPIDIWLGGVHLIHGGPIWRWDGVGGRLVACAS
jgi:hypothetical protein